MPVDPDELRDLQLAAAESARELRQYVAAACPGEHELRQHRDRRPPWCPACGLTALGYPPDAPPGPEKIQRGAS